MKKRMKLLALTLVCLLLLGFSGCSRPKTEVLIPVSVRGYNLRSAQDGNTYERNKGGYDFHYNEQNVLQKITVVDLNEQVTDELTVTADEDGRIASVVSASAQETYIWTTQGNLLSQIRADTKGERSIFREYNTKNEMLSVSLNTTGTRNAIDYEYNEDGKLVTARHYRGDTLVCRTEFTYLEDGRLETETLLDDKDQTSATAVYEYLQDGYTRVTVRKKAYMGAIHIQQGNTSTTIPADDPASTVVENTVVYTYDKAGFLVEEYYGENNKQNMRYQYTYITVTVSKVPDS